MDFASGSRFRFAPATPHKTAQKTEKTLEGDLRPMISNGS
jgi:hypothetical protein